MTRRRWRRSTPPGRPADEGRDTAVTTTRNGRIHRTASGTGWIRPFPFNEPASCAAIARHWPETSNGGKSFEHSTRSPTDARRGREAEGVGVVVGGVVGGCGLRGCGDSVELVAEQHVGW